MADQLLEVGEAQDDTSVVLGHGEAGDVVHAVGVRSCDRSTVATRGMARRQPVPVLVYVDHPDLV